MLFEPKALQSFHIYWRQQMDEECIGTFEDMALEGAWLENAAVIEQIKQRSGQWEVSLIFADPSRNSTFLVKHIKSCSSLKLAKTTAAYMRRVAAKDPQAAIEIGADNYALNLN